MWHSAEERGHRGESSQRTTAVYTCHDADDDDDDDDDECLDLCTILHANAPEPQLSMKRTARLEMKEQSTTGKMQFGWALLYGQIITSSTLTPTLTIRFRIAVRPHTMDGALAG